MTAILGLHYLNGILLMADTEETLGADAKSEADKIFRFIFPVGNPALAVGGTVITGGAGHAFSIDCANQELARFLSTGVIKSVDDVVPVLSKFARGCFKRSMDGYQGIDSGLVPHFEMLIAVGIRPLTWLFHWQENRVLLIQEGRHVAIGGGITWLHPMLRDVSFSATKECLLFHGMRMMYLTKRAVVGVGGKTEAVALQDDGITHYFGTKALQEIENLVVNYEQFKVATIDNTVSTILADEVAIAPELEANAEKHFVTVADDLRAYRERYKAILKPQLTVQKSTDQQ
jgi:hypothetical protein